MTPTLWAAGRVVLTGGPGAGKTTLLRELAARGFVTVDETARAVIAERRARGESPRPEPIAFAQEILRRDIERYRHAPNDGRWVFFDRGVVDALGLLHKAAPLTPRQLDEQLAAYPYHRTVFMLPPWPSIYTTDAERDQTWDQAVAVHASLVRWYHECGYRLYEVPPGPVAERADHVLAVLMREAGHTRVTPHP